MPQNLKTTSPHATQHLMSEPGIVDLTTDAQGTQSARAVDDFLHAVETFNEFGASTIIKEQSIPTSSIPVKYFINEFWTSKQRASSSLHEISYRACFKAQLPRFFVERLSSAFDIIYDPFMGRGTTLLEAALLKRRAYGCDINPLSKILIEPRFTPLTVPETEKACESLNFAEGTANEPRDLLHFFHPKTLNELIKLKELFLEDTTSEATKWLRMIATNRLTGHSPGFFSVYSLPPNQAVSAQSQERINIKRNQTPEYRDVVKLIKRKSKSLTKSLTNEQFDTLRSISSECLLLTGSSDQTPEIQSNSVQLVVTSPPFLDIVNYTTDNWLRCWFNGFDASSVPIWQLRKLEKWQEKMQLVFNELFRIVKPDGYVAFEVGEVRNGKVKLEESVIPLGIEAGFSLVCVVINQQEFTKTSHCWGVDNLNKGTNTNRIVVFRKH